MTVTIEGVDQIRSVLGDLISGERRKDMTAYIGRYVVEKVKDHLDEMSAKRHKVADRLGAKHTNYLEYASGRVSGVTEDVASRDQDVVVKDNTESSVTIAVRNTPGLRRAFHDLVIVPRKANALTIPLHRISYGKRVRDLREEGHKIFRLGKKDVLAELDGTEKWITDEKGKRKKRKGIRPLYCLKKSVTVPRDEGLLPRREDYEKWGFRGAGSFIRAEILDIRGNHRGSPR